MKYILEVTFETDDSDPDESEYVEAIRKDVKDVIENYSDTFNPTIKIREA